MSPDQDDVPPIEEAGVRAALCDRASNLLAPEDISSTAQEGRWLAVVLSIDSPSRDLIGRVYRRLVEAFPGRSIEVRAGRSTYRGGTGIGEGRHVIAVLGGKGGVGKSTVAVNLALALSAMGERVGLLDADINAPDIPHMLGVHGRSTARSADAVWSRDVRPPSSWSTPELRYGVEVMSVGFAVPERYPPRITSRLLTSTLLRRFVFEVAWSANILIVDAPPGTGEEIQTIASDLPLSGAIFVTTPQDLAQMDAERTLALLDEHNVPVIGLVKNMASMTCPHCARPIDMFAGSDRLRDAGVGIVAEIPFDVTLSSATDAGVPLVLADPRGHIAYEFAKIGSLTRSWLRTVADQNLESRTQNL